ncbi:3-isopropylmalate dehydratase small subunit [Bosea sp. BK604]|uniref:3-isopropylmalate dehydratase small subunit n=1 Tax=Bosea sp. BK604 TaxID=2512180 RepID=UPI001051D875|nr:3-isopropylmalate dehydratase small subunit [Bosea sp. BK604]TCR63486.1 3-isopropylmalate/(R)-2-methylmalate dehydratase small subunit [Bosea sp. BK604]
MEPFKTVTGIAAPLLQDDINTDQIIPSLYLRQLNGNLADGLFAYMRRKPDGTSNPDFVLEKPQFRSSAILVTGENFGCGSSREHAAWAMAAFGIRCIIGRSHAEYFRENCLKNGVLAISLEGEAMDSFIAAVNAVDGSAAFTVDLEAQHILGPQPEQRWRFAIAPFERVALLEGLDEIGLTMKHASAIDEWEARAAGARPYLQNFRLP